MKYERTAIAGFSLIELMVAVSIFAIIALISAPNISDWVNKAKARSNAEALQNSIRFAQSEAAKRNRLVEFSLVHSTTTPVAHSVAVDDGTAWIVRVVPSSQEAATVLQADVFSQEGVQLKGGNNKTLVFGGLGQVYTDVPSDSIPEPFLSATRAYQLVSAGDRHAFCVLVQPGGGVRWCDPSLVSDSRSCPGSAAQSCL